MTRLPIVPPLLLALAALAAAPAAPLPAQQADPVDRWVEAYMREHRIPGVALAIVERGRVVRESGYGLANVEHDVPVTPATVFQSGSVGKQFTAAAVLLLAEDGRLSVDDPIHRHLPDAPAAWRGITLRHLLAHTSGIADYGPPAVDFQRDYTDEELLRALYAMPLHFPPGTEWSYSNSGYALLGLIVNRLTGEHWGELLERRVFGPAGMETARVISDADIVPNRAAGYRLERGELKNQEWVSPTFGATADGALYLTVRDLARWDAALYGDALLTEASRRAMWTPARLADGSETLYGFGWGLSEPGERRSVEHGGAWQGFRSHIGRYLDDSVTVVVLANAAHADATWMAHNVAGLFRPSLGPAARTAIRLPAATLDGYAGTYRLPTGDTVVVSRQGNALVLANPGRRPRTFRPYAEGAFFEEGSEMRLLFDGGRALRLSTDPTSALRALRVDGTSPPR